MVLEGGLSHVIRVDRVDLHSVQVRYHAVETTGMDGDCLNQVGKCLGHLQRHAAWVRVVSPDHQSLVIGSCSQDGLLHADGYSSQFVPVEWDCQVRDLPKVLCLLLLNAHFEDLSLVGHIDEMVSHLIHACDWEIRHAILLRLLQEACPLCVVLLVNARWQIRLK